VRLTSCSNNPFEWHCLSTVALNQMSSRLLKIEQLLKQSGICEPPPPFTWDPSDVVCKATPITPSKSEAVKSHSHETRGASDADLAVPVCTPCRVATPGLEEDILHVISESLEGHRERMLDLATSIHEPLELHEHPVVDRSKTSADLCEHWAASPQIVTTSSACDLQSYGGMQDPAAGSASGGTPLSTSPSEEQQIAQSQYHTESHFGTDSTSQKKRRRRKKQGQMSAVPQNNLRWFSLLSHNKMHLHL